MNPGVYENLPFKDYQAIDAVSNSKLLKFAKSPAHLISSLEAGERDSDDLLLGRLVHCMLLEKEALR